MSDRGGSRLSRRAMLALLGGGAGAVAIGGAIALRSDDDPEPTPSDPAPAADPLRGRLPRNHDRIAGIARIGDRYRRLVPEEATRRALLAAIPMAEELPDRPRALELEVGARRDQIRADFASGDLVDIDGWQLSRTEARLAALISLDV